jgi:hypothetical protein
VFNPGSSATGPGSDPPRAKLLDVVDEELRRTGSLPPV